MKQIRRHFTYANVMSSIAVFLILGGATAVAAKKVGTGQLKAGSVRTGKIAKEAVKSGKIAKKAVTEARIADGAVTTSKIASDAVTGAKVNEATLAKVPLAQNSEQLGGVAASGYQQGLRFAVISANAGSASVVRGNATGAERTGVGVYLVSFAPDIRNCAYIATLGDIGAGGGENGEISVQQLNTGNPNTVEVRTYDSAGAPEDPSGGDGFHITVVC